MLHWNETTKAGSKISPPAKNPVSDNHALGSAALFCTSGGR